MKVSKVVQMMDRNDERLLGRWASEPGNQGGEDTTLEFKVGGQLDYTTHGTDTDQIMLLTYQ